VSNTPLIARHPEEPATVRVPFTVKRQHVVAVDRGASASRRKLWDFAPNLHCSIIGTCLTTAELRQILEKADGREPRCRTDHELHGEAVRIAATRSEVSRQLQHALERRHQTAVKRFERVKQVSDLLELWEGAKRLGDIAGPYWAVLTHRATDAAVLSRVFGDVHMLSHLLGAANRADIQRLARLEAERDGLQLKCDRQQSHLYRAIVERDEARHALEISQADRRCTEADKNEGEEIAALRQQVRGLEEKLGTETQRRAGAEQACDRAEQALDAAHVQLGDALGREGELLREIAALEDRLVASLAFSGADDGEQDLAGLNVLYVGGRASKVRELRAYVEGASGAFHFHDGGVEDRKGLLATMVERCDAVFFPVDCISHDAVANLKRVCRRGDKPYIPLRSASLSSFVGGLQRWTSSGLDLPEPAAGTA